MDHLQKASSFSNFSITLGVRILAALQHNDLQVIFKNVRLLTKASQSCVSSVKNTANTQMCCVFLVPVFVLTC